MKITNKQGLPQPFVDAVSSDYRYKPKRYSATSLLKGIREAVLQHRHDGEIEQDASEMVWLLFGKAVHSILENSVELPEQIKECKLVEDMGDGYELSGIFDLYDAKTETVYDYKTASTWKALFNDWEDYRRQLIIYAWMLEQAGLPCRHGELVVFYKDHSKTEAARRADYPQLPVERKIYDYTPADIEAAGEWISENFDAIKYAETLPDADLPMCTDEERWHKPDKWAVKKPGVKRAVRLYDTREEAMQHAAGTNLEIEYRPGEDTKCQKYCSVAQFCDHGRLLATIKERTDENNLPSGNQ